MSSATIPLALPKDLLGEVQSAAKETGLSQQDVMRQSMKLGLPTLRQLLGKPGRVTNVDPLPDAVLRKVYSERDDDEDSIRLFMKAQSCNTEE